MIVGIALAEALLLGIGFALDQPLLGVMTAGALTYALLAYRHPNLAWVLVWLAFPFAIEMVIPGGHALYVPTEPMIALAILTWSVRVLAGKPIRLPRSSLHAPLAVLAALTLLSVATSAFPGLGLKGLIAASGYVVFAYLYCFLNCHDAATVERSVPWIVGSGAVWGLFGTIRVLQQGLTLQHAYGAARPFFTEHGVYAAYLAMILPLALLFALERRGSTRVMYAGASLALALGIGFSLTRAAWISLAIVLPLTAALWFWWRRRLKPMALLAGLSVIVCCVILGVGAGGRITKHAGSIAATEDASNLERFNRWMAAVEMVRDRPLLGMGYASYPHMYTQYRRKLIITELAFVHSGAHSEIFRLLSEGGVLGFLAAMWLVGAAAVLGLRIFRRSDDQRARLIALASLAGLGTYAIHGFFRTYIDLEKVAVPFWAGLGVLAALGREFDPADGSLSGRTPGTGT
ncbi:MAG: hypothetical protein E6K74_00650 [Candidatus Eisenbacteria bacterium]|uniref:O-antigen ligase-related domain-containing protein n=1 Tax=Eiseniibacteriota bacterium TaxID=2212470 RepID=A0A538SXV1_UNCEI|nr:MAG: hypothetical protein E6K74_00650 [Candidatus Eisenbacteria bacterium]